MNTDREYQERQERQQFEFRQKVVYAFYKIHESGPRLLVSSFSTRAVLAIGILEGKVSYAVYPAWYQEGIDSLYTKVHVSTLDTFASFVKKLGHAFLDAIDSFSKALKQLADSEPFSTLCSLGIEKEPRVGPPGQRQDDLRPRQYFELQKSAVIASFKPQKPSKQKVFFPFKFYRPNYYYR